MMGNYVSSGNMTNVFSVLEFLETAHGECSIYFLLPTAIIFCHSQMTFLKNGQEKKDLRTHRTDFFFLI